MYIVEPLSWKVKLGLADHTDHIVLTYAKELAKASTTKITDKDFMWNTLHYISIIQCAFFARITKKTQLF